MESGFEPRLSDSSLAVFVGKIFSYYIELLNLKFPFYIGIRPLAYATTDFY